MTASPGPGEGFEPTPDDDELVLTGELAALADDTEVDLMAGPIDMDALYRLQRLKRQKALHKAAMDGLGPSIAELTNKIVEMVLPHTTPDGHWQATVGAATGYLATTQWPARNVDESTGQKYETDDLIAALVRYDDSVHLVTQSVNAQRLAAWMRERIEQWRAMRGEEGRHGPDGTLLDADGEPLSDEESENPTADELALPKAVRKIISVSTKLDVNFRQR